MVRLNLMGGDGATGRRFGGRAAVAAAFLAGPLKASGPELVELLPTPGWAGSWGVWVSTDGSTAVGHSGPAFGPWERATRWDVRADAGGTTRPGTLFEVPQGRPARGRNGW
jgi:hypothetical protein